MKKTTATKKSASAKSTKSSATVKDLKPKKNPKGGILPAVQKVREAGGRA
jgi:hypothetical protein